MRLLSVKLIAATSLTCVVASPAIAQPRPMERSIERQREAVAAWTTCIADEQTEDVEAMLVLDFEGEEYRKRIGELSETRVSSECFEAMPRAYRRIKLGGLPFAGGLAEQLLKADNTPLINRLSMAAIGPAAQTFSYTDAIAMCTVRGAPNLVAALFDSEVNSDNEIAAADALVPVTAYCTAGKRKFEASAFGLRSMLATASYRLLAAQDSVEAIENVAEAAE